jgi:hypothetical protein
MSYFLSIITAERHVHSISLATFSTKYLFFARHLKMLSSLEMQTARQFLTVEMLYLVTAYNALFISHAVYELKIIFRAGSRVLGALCKIIVAPPPVYIVHWYIMLNSQ